MARNPTTWRPSARTKRQVQDLIEWGEAESASHVIEIAIERLHLDCQRRHAPEVCPRCKTPMTWYPHLNGWVQQCDCE